MKANIFLFDNFETLDVFGPVEVLGYVPDCQLHFVSCKGGIINSSQEVPVMTKKLDAENISGLFFIPGGQGIRTLINDSETIALLKKAVQKAQYCLTVCTGSLALAKTGLLDGRKATSNKRAFEWVLSQKLPVLWERSARWTNDGEFYTSSGVSAGIDMTLGFTEDHFSRKIATDIAIKMEYMWNDDKTNDPFAACTTADL